MLYSYLDVELSKIGLPILFDDELLKVSAYHLRISIDWYVRLALDVTVGCSEPLVEPVSEWKVLREVTEVPIKYEG